MDELVDPQLVSAMAADIQPGINVVPGDSDDGWAMPEVVRLEDGSTIQLLKDGEALREAYQAIEQARQRILLEVYIFASDETGRAFSELLCKKSRAGVNVNVVFDSFGSVASDAKMFKEMRAAGIKLIEFHPFLPWRSRGTWHPMNRDHRKLLVIDNEIAWMGGLNIGSEYAGSWVVATQKPHHEFWRDTAIVIRGQAVRYYVTAYARLWSYAQRRKRVKAAEYVHNLPMPPMDEGGAGDLGILASVPCLHSPLKPLLKRFIDNSKKSLCLTMAYFAPHDELIDQLCRAARRGVKVRLMLPGRGDVKLLMIAARSFYEKLLTVGVQIYERQHAVLHAKTMVADGMVSVVGSTNMDYRSIEHNLELSTVIRSAAFGKQMLALFENDVKYAKRIRLHHWRHRPNSDRLIQWLVSRARYWL